MKAEIAVATVSGKAYYVIVNELKKRNLSFASLLPTEPIPIEIKVVITTEGERHLIKHERLLIYHDEMEPEALINETLQIIQGKERYEKVVIGIDPGEAFGLAVLADGKAIQTANCFSVEETVERIQSALKHLERTQIASISVKVGDGVPACKEKLLQVLDKAVPANVMLESVSEAGTNHDLNETKHRRGLRDIVSAIKIAGRDGHIYPRRKTDESDS